jgi:hypothetical protein
MTAARTMPRTRRTVVAPVASARFGGAPLVPFETEIGREVAVYPSSRNWGEKLLNPTIVNLLNRRPPPRLYLSVQASFAGAGHNPIRWADIAAGLYNAEIDSWAAELVTITAATRVYLCFHHEPEKQEGKCGSPADFQNAYWYFRDRIEVVNGVANLTWVATFLDVTFRGGHGGPDVWWPGASQFGLPVDQLLGVDIFNRGLCHSKEWRWFDWLAVKPWQFAAQVGRPLFIGECGCVEGDACNGTLPHGTAKAEWFVGGSDDVGALEYLRDYGPSQGWPHLEAFCYTNVDEYRIDTSAEAESAMRTMANDAFFSEPP